MLGALLSFAGVAVEPPKSAQAPDQQQLMELLSGNTLDGVWAGRPFRKYFAPFGSTQYREGNGPPSRGTWRINSSGQYCSVWPPSTREACYEVLIEGNNVSCLLAFLPTVIPAPEPESIKPVLLEIPGL